MTTEEQFAEQRRRNRTAYAIEDWHEARSALKYPAIVNIALGLLLSVGWLIDSGDLPHVAIAVGTGLGLYPVQQYAVLEKRGNLYGLVGVYVIVVMVEYLLYGLPDPIFPELTVEKGWVGFVPIVNSLFPIVYLFVRFAMAYYCVSLLLQLQKLRAEPISVIRQFDRELAGRLS